jgi:hypothetical protein
MGKMSKEYFQQLNWKQAGWKHELKLDKKRTIPIFRIYKDPKTFEYSFTDYTIKTNNGYITYEGTLDQVWPALNRWLLRAELEANNHFFVEEANDDIENKIRNTAQAAKHTRTGNEHLLAGRIHHFMYELANTWVGDIEEYPSAKYAGTLAAAIKYNIKPIEVSRAAGIYYKEYKVPTKKIKLDPNDDWPVMVYPSIVLEASIMAIVEKKTNDNNFI